MKVDYITAFSGIQKQQILDKYGLDGGRTQKVIDSSFMEYLDKYMPADNDMQMINSMYQLTRVGSGEINIDGPHAHYQNEGELYVDPQTGKGAFLLTNGKDKKGNPNVIGFYSRKGVKKVPSGKKLNYHGGPLRGDHFTERMLADHFEDILKAGQKEIDK